jgi:hypothetical protein
MASIGDILGDLVLCDRKTCKCKHEYLFIKLTEDMRLSDDLSSVMKWGNSRFRRTYGIHLNIFHQSFRGTGLWRSAFEVAKKDDLNKYSSIRCGHRAEVMMMLVQKCMGACSNVPQAGAITLQLNELRLPP